MTRVDAVLAEARRLRARETDRLLVSAARHSVRVLQSVVAPMLGWQRRAVVSRASAAGSSRRASPRG